MRMQKGVGKAFEKAMMIKEEELTGEKEGKFEFMNKNRQEIFQYLCLHPCSHAKRISQACGLSQHATNWHLRRLLEDNYISKKSIGKKMVYYPSNMIAVEDIPILEILNIERAKSIYVSILEKKGVSQKEICEKLNLNHQAVIWYAKKLESLGLISSLEDGKFRRYYPTDLLIRKKDENTKRLRIFRDKVMKRFQRERLSPTILRTTEDKIVLRIVRGKDRAVLTLHTNPFVSVLS
ncbi:MAG: winged helix-turn-helix transcriptional regulator [Thermoplasmata archaeon]|nr:MAG: winged helix-turn-helix transcriptional regulator [Thermoplasmata archaeon]